MENNITTRRRSIPMWHRLIEKDSWEKRRRETHSTDFTKSEKSDSIPETKIPFTREKRESEENMGTIEEELTDRTIYLPIEESPF